MAADQVMSMAAGNVSAIAAPMTSVPHVEDIGRSSGLYLAALTIASLFVLVNWLSTPNMDAQEPPLIRPTVPFIGHLVSLVRDQGKYLRSLQKNNLPVATLPILGGKTYVIFDAQLMQSAMRQRTLSFEPFAVDFAQRLLGITDESYRAFRGTEERESLVPEFFQMLHTTMKGPNLHQMNARALNTVSEQLAPITEKWTEVPNAYSWIRDVITLATCSALLGKHNPLAKNEQLIEDLWDWEAGTPLMFSTDYHNLTVPQALKGREAVQQALSEYYINRLDEDETVAEVTKARARVLRKYGVTDYEVGRFEAQLLQLATGNTIPTIFWIIAHIWVRPDLMAKLREELTPLAQFSADNDDVTVDITKLEELCPLLISCYRESIRLTNHILCARRIVKDTVITDNAGKSYLLKAGFDVQIPASVTHNDEATWGANALEYDPERFLTATTDKNKRAAYFPFGGGRHLCPGRHFAFSEVIGAVAALILGYDVAPIEGEEKPWVLPDMAKTTMMGGAVKPVGKVPGETFGVRIRRRQGWEKVQWKFIAN